MALLPVETRKQYFKDLGLGEYNKANILKLQKKYMKRKADYDGIYGTNTDNLLRTCWNVWFYAGKNFSPEEFVCECSGRYCCGYPSYMKPHELANIQAIRSHWGKPVEVTCGLRCKKQNSKVGGITHSRHLTGQAIDFHQTGVTDTLAQRKKAIKWIKTLPNHNYTYGHLYDSNGYRRSAPGMGNCLHHDTK